MKNSPSTPNLFEIAFKIADLLDEIYDPNTESDTFCNVLRTIKSEVEIWPEGARERLYKALEGIPYNNVEPEEIRPALQGIVESNF